MPEQIVGRLGGHQAGAAAWMGYEFLWIAALVAFAAAAQISYEAALSRVCTSCAPSPAMPRPVDGAHPGRRLVAAPVHPRCNLRAAGAI